MQKPELGPAGNRLWGLVMKDFELSTPELLLFGELAHTADELAVLHEASEQADVMVEGSAGQKKVNPLFRELREHRALFVKLLAELALPSEDEEKGKTPSQRRASEAANARWELERQKWGRGGKTA
ncbi:hypothetical protein [Nonomuraea lactucae]|uniref:hypothetical protein n=1 Tax=Nonomuraea lactucae TaxID=2249762 RepID=UPI0013B44CCC|nr:hypothetical protein [Nonomuraea lactucae]